MPIMRMPRNPLPLTFVPSGGRPHKVLTNESLVSIARTNGISEAELNEFNFGTTAPAEVNWYLLNRVGCTKASHDGNNWMFTTDAVPGIIYLPPNIGWKRPSFPPSAPHVTENKPEHSGTWFGFAAQGGGHLFVAGKDTMEAWLFSTDSYKDNFFLNIDGWRVGPGLGGGVGLIFVLGTGGKSPHAFQDLKVSGVDFQLNFGPRWGAIAKGLKGLKFVSKFARAGKIIEKGISLAEWEKLRDVILDLIKTGEINVHTEKPEIESFAIPLPHTGGGVEASVYYGWGRCFVHNVTLRN